MARIEQDPLECCRHPKLMPSVSLGRVACDGNQSKGQVRTESLLSGNHKKIEKALHYRTPQQVTSFKENYFQQS